MAWPAATSSRSVASAPTRYNHASPSSPQIPSQGASPHTWLDENHEPYLHPEHFGSFGDARENIVSTPAPVTTTRSFFGQGGTINHAEGLAIPCQLNEQYQKPLTALLPIETNIEYNERTPSGPDLASQNHSFPLNKPSTQQQQDELDMTIFTGEKDATQPTPVRGLTSWFNNTTTPASESTDNSATTPSTAVSASGMLYKLTPTLPSSATKSRFSFFSSNPVQPSPSDKNKDEDADPLLTLSIPSALTPSPHDPFSPASSKNLHASALALLSTFQSALRKRTAQVTELRDEADAREEEREAADMRTQHLKAQLAEMAERVAEQENTLKNILGELVEERRKSAEEREKNAKSVLVVERDRDRTSGMSEDLEVGKWKGVAVVEESDAESTVDSVWSRCGSPDGNRVVSGGSSVSAFTAGSETRRETLRKGSAKEEVRVVRRCDNCEGKGSSVAWVAVRDLREENKELKAEAVVLREAVDEVLAMVGAIGI